MLAEPGRGGKGLAGLRPACQFRAMIVPLVLFAVSVLGVLAGLMPGLPDWLLPLSAVCALAALVLAGQAWRRKPARKAVPRWVVVDGSNVMYWQDGTPRIEPVVAVVRLLEARGFTPGVVFDANAGYLLEGRYRHHHAFSLRLSLPEDRVMVVPKGEPADPFILTVAQDYGARVVTNDRYRDWAGQFPQVAEPGFLIAGGYRDGALWLATDQP